MWSRYAVFWTRSRESLAAATSAIWWTWMDWAGLMVMDQAKYLNRFMYISTQSGGLAGTLLGFRGGASKQEVLLTL
ncbi:hypothetical protein BKA66DRAFT_91165 [Pyrenochaeta sp. MPI-SDFR-AT-0127]|nr:hypothetical protein BKA66DRAFT_91165 [Pyrenochaeta sp. MPI-SDFR-AT-0127]